MSEVGAVAGSARRGRPGHDRDAVVRTATQLFDRHGYDRTSVGDIARELGVSKSAIYHHVRSKEHLLELAVADAMDALDAALTEVSAAGLAPDARLRESVRRSVEVLLDHLASVRLLLDVRGNTELEQQFLDRRRDIDRRLAALVEAAVAAGSLRDDVDPRLLSRLIFGTVNSLVRWVNPDQDTSELAETVASVTFDGLTRRSRG